MIFEIKLVSNYLAPGITMRIDKLEDLLDYIRSKVPVVENFSPGITIRPTKNPVHWELLIYDNFKLEEVSDDN